MANDPNIERELEKRLRSEADAARPVFSETLHTRICEAVQASPSDSPMPPTRRRVRRFAAPVGTAAACTAAVVVAFVLWGTVWFPAAAPPDKSPDPIAGLDALAKLSDETVAGVGEYVNSTLAKKKWAYLDQDVETATQMLADRLSLKMLVPKDEP